MKRTYSKEFKEKACELVIKDGIKHAVVAEKMGISHIMLYRWIDEYQTYGEEAFVFMPLRLKILILLIAICIA